MPKRPEYKKPTKASQILSILSKLTPEERDSPAAAMALKKAKISFSSSELSTARKRLRSSTGDGYGKLVTDINLVKRTANQVGGMSSLRDLITLIERLRS